jgi:two-component system cell cycle response regulator DivK
MAQCLLYIAGYQILEAKNADEGIHLARSFHPDLILMDIHLPIKSGYEASKELKNYPETSTIPIVAFTSLAMGNEQKRALAHGCVGVITKPIDIKQFAKTVGSFLNSALGLGS